VYSSHSVTGLTIKGSTLDLSRTPPGLKAGSYFIITANPLDAEFSSVQIGSTYRNHPYNLACTSAEAIFTLFHVPCAPPSLPYPAECVEGAWIVNGSDIADDETIQIGSSEIVILGDFFQSPSGVIILDVEGGGTLTVTGAAALCSLSLSLSLCEGVYDRL
jgi:hypothetical protein